MRKEIGITVIGTVVAQLIVWLLQAIADSNPASKLGEAASVVSKFLTTTLQVPFFVGLIVLAVIARMVYEAYRQKAVIEVLNKNIEQIQAPKPVSAAELTVLEALAHASSIDVNDLLQFSGLNEVRLNNALHQLEKRDMVIDVVDHDGDRMVTLLPAGTQYIVEQNLDKADTPP